ncbi:lysophospholipid acyltransferase family protein [Allonocardiopsis opalescens]|uniref:1-acyl-sn-glycerol-3-phosphate acyltransferase n=1 Tax=Allonocardiopsis opalescens TaxID=1144618 RepID=A0A2T0PVT8_9ACTN|nr:lysophospholipid acyltransferase family protein [Allonocardiopsis opalescens]PRX95655.1 1-acyl-sn-glycerol-3-phosphate acyltransferase [Allonocardiopsis opalescens]
MEGTESTPQPAKRRGYSAFWRFVIVVILRPLLFGLLKRDWRGQEHIPRTGAVIFAVNHLSNADPLAVGHFVYEAGRWPFFLAKSGVFRIPVVGPIIRSAGQIPVYRDRAEAGLALRDAEKALRDNDAAIVVYPEGTCTRDPELWPMAAKTGIARLALRTGVPVVPIANWGPQELLPYGSVRPRLFPRKTMRVTAGPPVDLSAYRDMPLSAATLRAATADVMRAVTELQAGIRGETPPAVPYDPRRARAAGAAGTAAVETPPEPPAAPPAGTAPAATNSDGPAPSAEPAAERAEETDDRPHDPAHDARG